MRVALTGATGFIGPHVHAVLREAGHELRCLVRDPARATELLGPAPPPGSWAGRVQGDLRRQDSLRRLCEDAEAVVHLAGVVGSRDPSVYEAVNVRATGELFRTAERVARTPCRTVLVSSLAAAGPGLPDAPARPGEGRPVSLYGKSKLAAERLLASSRSPWIVLRPGAVFGPGDREFLPLFRAARRRIVPVPGSAGRMAPLVYVADVARVIGRALSTTVEGRAYTLVGRPLLTVRELAGLLHAALVPGRSSPPRVIGLPGRCVVAAGRLAGLVLGSRLPPTWTPDRLRELLVTSWPADASALAEDLGWRSWTAPPEALAETAAWYAAQGFL